MNTSSEHPHHTIWTPELVDITMPLAGIGRRAAAMTIDLTLVWSAIFVLIVAFIAVMAFMGRLLSEMFDGPTMMMVFITALIVAFLVILALHFVYFWTLHTFNHGQTLGKRWLKIRVVSERGGEINAWTAFVRGIFDLVDFVLFSYGLSAIMVMASEREKRIADWASGTMVILAE